MSRASAQVKFPDGTIRFGVYHGTSDVYYDQLYDTPEAAWTAYRDGSINEWLEESLGGEEYDVEIADDYGGGETYRGRATKYRITSTPVADEMESIKQGLPDWWVKEDTA